MPRLPQQVEFVRIRRSLDTLCIYRIPYCYTYKKSLLYLYSRTQSCRYLPLLKKSFSCLMPIRSISSASQMNVFGKKKKSKKKFTLYKTVFRTLITHTLLNTQDQTALSYCKTSICWKISQVSIEKEFRSV